MGREVAAGVRAAQTFRHALVLLAHGLTASAL